MRANPVFASTLAAVYLVRSHTRAGEETRTGASAARERLHRVRLS